MKAYISNLHLFFSRRICDGLVCCFIVCFVHMVRLNLTVTLYRLLFQLVEFPVTVLLVLVKILDKGLDVRDLVSTAIVTARRMLIQKVSNSKCN